jgi:hypothetical protein
MLHVDCLVLLVGGATAEGTLLALGPLAAGGTLADGTTLLMCAVRGFAVLGVGTATRGGGSLLKGTGHCYNIPKHFF